MTRPAGNHLRESSRSRALRVLVLLVSLVVVVPAVLAQRVNVAKYQTVTASAQTESYLADFATDSIVSNFHSLRSGNQSGPFWVEVSYPRLITIASAHLYLGLLESANPSQVLSGFRFQYHNGISWVDIPGTTVNGNKQTELALTFSQPVNATRFRLYSTDKGSRAVRELAFFPPNIVGGVEQGFPIGTDVNLSLAYKRPASSSSAQLTDTNGPGYAKNAFDGYVDNASRWISSTNGPGELIEVDLLSTHRIGSAHVYSGIMDSNRVTTSPIPSFELRYLSGTNWVVIPGATITNNTQTNRVVEFSQAVSATRVRLVTTSATPVRLMELQIYPPRTGGYAVGREVVHAAPPTNTWETYSDSFYRIRNSGPDLRIGLVNGAVVNVPSDNNNPERTEWQLLLNHRDGSYRVRNAGTGLCLALAQISKASDTGVVAEQYTGLPHQDWRLVFSTATNFHLANVYSGLVIQPAGSSWTSGTPLVVRSIAAGNATQLWNANFRRSYPKKGIAATTGLIRTSSTPYVTNSDLTFHQDFYDRLGGSWSYTWGRQVSSNFPYIDDDHAVSPMQWGDYSWTHGSSLSTAPFELNHRDIQSNPKPVYVMGFNEPDKTEQGFITVENAVMRWPRLEARDAPLVAPVPANPFSEWNTNFVAQADALGYRRDYTPVHWYDRPGTNAGSHADGLINRLQRAYTNYGRPVWLTEFSTVRWDVSGSTATWTHADNFNFLAEFLWRAESLPWLKRYSLFIFLDNTTTNNPAEAPRGNAFRANGSLTPFGELYAGWDGVTNVVVNRAYHLHNYGAYQRARNPGGTSAPTAVSPDLSTAGLQWRLSPGLTTNTFLITSTQDGRPLRYVDGTNAPLTFGTNGETGTAVEWRLVAAEYGLQCLQHPASSSKRLQLATNGTYAMVASNSTNSLAKWRFVGPAVPEPSSAPATPSGLAATGAAAAISLSWSPAVGASGYTLQRLDTALQSWNPVATDITHTLWNDTGLPSSTTHTYRVIATNDVGASAPSAIATATTLHPMASMGAWQAEYLASLPPENQTGNADPDKDGIVNLFEYAYASLPTQPGGSPLRIDRSASPGDVVTVRFPWNWRATDITWRIRGGTDLGNRAAWIDVEPQSVDIVRDGDVDRVEVTLPVTNAEREFFSLELVLPGE